MANNTVILTDPEDQSTTYFPVTVREAVLDLGPFSGSTSTNSGSSGLVPSPGTSDRFGLLCGSGSWMTPQESGYLYFESTNGWTTTGSAGGGGITQKFTLNGTTYSGSSLSGTGGIYAPTSSGVSDAILVGGYSNTPAWYVPGNLGGFLKFRGENLGWTVDTSSYMPTGSFSFYWRNSGSSSHNWATLTPGGSLTLVGSSGVTLDAPAGDPSTLYINATVGIRSIYMGVGLTSNIGSLVDGNSATMSLEPATTSSIGGLAVGRIDSSVNPVVLGAGTPLALERGVQDKGFVRVPTIPSTPASIALGNPGLLMVAADVDPTNGYINDTAVVAVPIFYGTISSLKRMASGNPFEIDHYVDEKQDWKGHYINVRDIVNGIINHEELRTILSASLSTPKRE